MKKEYITPETRNIILEVTSLLAASATFDSTKTIQSNEDIGVKSSRQDYNVWDEDWSK